MPAIVPDMWVNLVSGRSMTWRNQIDVRIFQLLLMFPVGK
jgi:hypothetical protein